MEDDIQNHLPTVMFRGTPCCFKLNQLRKIRFYEKEEGEGYVNIFI